MKKKVLTFVFLFLTIFLVSTKTFSQTAPGDGGSGTGTSNPPPDNGSTGGTGVSENPDLIITFGSSVIDIPATSPYYSCITSLLTYLHATITNGVVTFPSLTCYNGCVKSFYYTGCINYKTYQTACKTPPTGCH